jgi:protocatechuate 3,4-dioxygenase beta subunit
MARNIFLFVLLLAGSLAAGGDEPGPPGTGSTHSVHFSGRVVDVRGRPVAGAAVYVSLYDRPVTDPFAPPRVCRATAGADGSFQLTAPVPEKDWPATVVAVREGQGPGGVEVRSAAGATGLVVRLTTPSFLEGRVVDRAGQPAAGAKVSLAYAYLFNQAFCYLPPEEDRPPVITDAQGRFRLAPLTAHSRLVVRVEHPAFGRWNSMMEPITSGASNMVIALPPPSSVTGRVVGEDGRPAPGVTVRCRGDDPWGPQAARTDAAGSFRFTGLRSGHYFFAVEFPQPFPEYAADLQGAAPPEGGEARCPDLRLVRGGIVTGKVTDDHGQPVAGMEVGARHDIRFPETNSVYQNMEGPGTRTGPDGVYRLRLPPGRWRVSPVYFGSAYLSDIEWDAWPQREVVEGGSVHADFTLQKAAGLRGLVRDADGRPAAGAAIELGPRGRQTADATGRFVVDPSLPPKQATPLAVFSRDRLQGATLEVRPAALKGPLVMRLQRLPALTGVVTDPRGNPIEGAWISAERMVPAGGGMSGHRPEAVTATTTDERGRFRLGLFPGTRYRVSVTADGFGSTDRFPVIAGAAGRPLPPLRFRLSRTDGFIAGTVEDVDGQRLPGAEVTAMRLGETNAYVIGEHATTDAQGRFRLANLPPGEMQLYAGRLRYQNDFQRRVKVGATNVRFVLAPIEEGAPPPPLSAGERAPEIPVERWINGAGPSSLTALRGKIVVLQFSAPYNAAAKASNAALKALAAALAKTGRQDVVLLALYDDAAPAEEAAAYARSEALPFPIGLVGDSTAFKAYHVRRLPTLFVIDAEGIVRAVDPDEETLRGLTLRAPGG